MTTQNANAEAEKNLTVAARRWHGRLGAVAVGGRFSQPLTRIGKQKRAKTVLSIVLEQPQRVHQAIQRVNEVDLFDNRLIFGFKLC